MKAVNFLRFGLLGFFLLALVACETTDGKHILTTAAGGTEMQAERLVSSLLGKAAKPLIYRNAEIDQALERMRARWPQLLVELERGHIGLTDDGMLRVRQSDGRLAELKQLVRAENFDRQALYRGLCAEVGYADGKFVYWLPFTEDVFGKEWIKQAPLGWWYADAEGKWLRKEKSAATP